MKRKHTPKPGIYFINRHADGDTVMFKTHKKTRWPELLEQFKHFLLACGYVLPFEGNFELVPTEEEVPNHDEGPQFIPEAFR